MLANYSNKNDCPDKSGRLAVMPLELYTAAGEVHTSKDKEDKFAEETIINTLNVAKMYLLYKDHKLSDGGPPKTRPVASAINGFNVQYSTVICSAQS